MAICQWHAMWDVRPEKEGEYVGWMLDVFRPFWTRQPGVRSFRGFLTLVGGPPCYVAEFDCDDLASLLRILESREWRRVESELRSFTTGYASRILAPTGRGDDPA